MSIRRRFAVFASLACTVFLAGWGPQGHAVVAEIAWRNLTPEVQAKVNAILEGAEMSSVGSWADAVRPTDEFRWTAPLHYVNLPDNALRYIHERDCPEVGCVVSAIDDFSKVLGDDSADPQKRAEALMFVIHFVGDLHQPLHAGRSVDRGGNDIHIQFNGNEQRLHRVWDSGLIESADNGDWEQWADRLLGEIDEMDRVAWTADFNSNDLINSAGRWAYESNRLALEYAYSVPDGSEVGAEYVELTTPVIELRLSQGGVRLASLLNALLGED